MAAAAAEEEVIQKYSRSSMSVGKGLISSHNRSRTGQPVKSASHHDDKISFLLQGGSSRRQAHLGGSGVMEEDTKPPIDLNNLAHNPVVYPSEDGQHISSLPGGMQNCE